MQTFLYLSDKNHGQSQYWLEEFTDFGTAPTFETETSNPTNDSENSDSTVDTQISAASYETKNSAPTGERKTRSRLSQLDSLKLLQCVCLNARKIKESRMIRDLKHPKREGKLSKGFYKQVERYLNNTPEICPADSSCNKSLGKSANNIRSHFNKV